MTFSDLFVWGLAAHLFSDFILQSQWMSDYKGSLTHPAAWVHSGIQALCLWPVFGWKMALLLGYQHIVIDTRRPLAWWREVFRQMPDPKNIAAVPFFMLQDQAVHIICLVFAAWVVSKGWM